MIKAIAVAMATGLGVLAVLAGCGGAGGTGAERAAVNAPATANFDWPQWQGHDRTAISREPGLLKSWPKEGPPLVWKIKGLGGGCLVPIAGYATIAGGELELLGLVTSTDGAQSVSSRITGPSAHAEDLGRRLAEVLLQQGAAAILAGQD